MKETRAQVHVLHVKSCFMPLVYAKQQRTLNKLHNAKSHYSRNKRSKLAGGNAFLLFIRKFLMVYLPLLDLNMQKGPLGQETTSFSWNEEIFWTINGHPLLIQQSTQNLQVRGLNLKGEKLFLNCWVTEREAQKLYLTKTSYCGCSGSRL